jgi:RHS repeat-associated protein
MKQPYTYTGREYDEETGLYCYRARYYSPDLQRFISEDPIGFEGGDVNLYAYVHSNPVNRIDPLGLTDRYTWCEGTPGCKPLTDFACNISLIIRRGHCCKVDYDSCLTDADPLTDEKEAQCRVKFTSCCDKKDPKEKDPLGPPPGTDKYPNPPYPGNPKQPYPNW